MTAAPRGRGWTEAEDRRLEELRAAGLTRGQIADALGKTRGQVQGRVRALGVPLGCDAAGSPRRGGGPPDAGDVRRRLDAVEIVMVLEEALAAIEGRPTGTTYEARLAAAALGMGEVLREARREEREGRDGQG